MTDIASLGIKIEASDIKQAVAELDRLDNQAGKTEKATQSLNKSFFDLKSAVAALGVVYLTKQLLDNINTYQGLENQLRLVTSSSEELASVQDRLFQIAQETRNGLESTIEVYSRFARSTKDLNLSSEQLAAITTTVNQAIAISGVSATSANAAIIQFGQGLSSGTLRGEELNSIMEQTPRLAQALAEGLGVGIGQLRTMGTAGELTGERLVAALQNQSSIVATEFGQTEKTVSQAMTQIQNVILQTFGSINSDGLIDALDEFRATISDPKIAEDLTHVAEALLKLVTLTVQAAAGIGEVFHNISEATKVTAEWFAAYTTGQISFFEWLTTGSEGATKRLDEIQVKLWGVADANAKATEQPASIVAPENISTGLPMPTDEQIQEWMTRDLAIAQLEQDALRERESEKELIEREGQEKRRINILQFYTDEETYAREKAEKLKVIQDKETADQISRGESAFSTMLGNVASHNKTFFQIQKVYRLSKLAMEAPAAIADSYAWGASWGGPPAGATMAGIAGLAMAGYASQLLSANYGGGGGSASAGTGGQNAVTGPVSPGVTTLFPQDQQQEARGATTIIINGTIIGHEDYVNNTMLPLIKTAISERDYVLVEANSLNGLELSA